MYQQVLKPVGDSYALTSIFAALPILTLFVLLGVLKVRAWVSALTALVVAIAISLIVYSMPVGQALLSASEGATFGFFPILWIVINAIWIYNLTVATGHFDVLRRSFGGVSSDMRVQAIIIAFCFGALLEALAGFGTPVAISAVMLIALGFPPLKAATVALIANTAPVAFGALAIPIVTLAEITAGVSNDPRLTVDTLGSMVGRQTPILAVFVPLVIVGVVDGRRGLRQTWLPAVLAGGVFGLVQYFVSNFISVTLTDIFASLLSMAAIVVLVRVWQPVESPDLHSADDADVETARGGGEGSTRTAPGRAATATRVGGDAEGDSRGEIARAYAPYLIIIAIFSIANITTIKDALAKAPWYYEFQWPGLNVTNTSGDALSSITFAFGWLAAAGTLLVIAGLITLLVLQVSPGRAAKAYVDTLVQLRTAILTVMGVLALAYVMNQSGQTTTLGFFLAGAGTSFVVLSPILGWLGVSVTGSDTSSNALFGALQVQTATKAGLDPVLLAAANSSGGVMGKMLSPQNLAIAAAAVGMAGREGEIFRKVLGWSLLLLALVCILVTLQATPVLSWMVPG
ncbi:MAG: lactate permease [Nocardioidaceae bacterium]|jgi:lactate permease|nr:lactate permease [Nocardioidaceae bacterium]